MRNLLIAAGVASLLAVSAFAPSPAQASWAENAQGNPLYTGTNQSLWKSERGRRHFSHQARRGWHATPGHGWSQRGYNAYGYAPGYSSGHRGYGYYR